MRNKQLSYYLDQYAQGKATQAELEILNERLQDPANQAALEQFMKDNWDFWAKAGFDMPEITEGINKGVASKLFPEENMRQKRSIVFAMQTWRWVAAVLLVIAGVGVYQFIAQENRDDISNTPIGVEPQPGGNSAMLTLADGSSILLDSAGNGTIAQQGNASVMKLEDGQIAYAFNGDHREEARLNTMTTPNGGQYQLTLPDGTKLWLNAASSVTFPAAFSAKERTIQVSGEVYMEVAQKKNWPFKVKTSNTMITVLGTAFNINAYSEESVHRTTLVSGAVKLQTNAKEVVLKPGQQAVIDKGEMQVAAVDIEQQLAWKNGFINFEDKSFEEAMRELARWYNVEVVYPKGVPAVKLGGEIRRNISINSMISSLNALRVHASIEGNKIIVLPK